MGNRVQIVDAVIIRGDRFLLVQQRKESVFGQWGLPGGHVEPDESPEQAIQREVKEELGIKPIPFLKIQQIIPPEENLTVISFSCHYDDQIVTVQHEELIGYGWFTLEDIRQIKQPLRSSWILPLITQIVENTGIT